MTIVHESARLDAEHERIDHCVFWSHEGVAVFGCEA